MGPKPARGGRSTNLKASLVNKNITADDDKFHDEMNETLLEAFETGGADAEITKETLQTVLEKNLKKTAIGGSEPGNGGNESPQLSKTETTGLDHGKNDNEVDSGKALDPNEEEASEDSEEDEREKYTVPEGIPGTGTVVRCEKASDLDVVIANLDLIKVKKLSDLTRLCDRIIHTPFGETEVSPYSQVMIRTASIYYRDIKNVGYSADAIRAIHYATVSDETRLKMIEDNKSRPLREFLEKERLRYLVYSLKGLLMEEKNHDVADIFSVISEDEMKGRLAALEAAYRDAYHVYSIISVMVNQGVTVVMPVPPFLKSSAVLCDYIDAIAQGGKVASELVFNVPARVAPISPSGQVSSTVRKGEKRTLPKDAGETGKPRRKKVRVEGSEDPVVKPGGTDAVRNTSNFEEFTELFSLFESKIEALEAQRAKDNKEFASFKESVNKRMAEMSGAIKSLVVARSEGNLAKTVHINKTLKETKPGAKFTEQEKGKGSAPQENAEDLDMNMSEEGKSLVQSLSVFKRGDEEKLAERVNKFWEEHGESQYKIVKTMLLVPAFRNRLMANIRRYENSG